MTRRPNHQFKSQPKDGTVPGAGLRLHYLDWGGSGQPDILFLHGFALTAHTWDVVCDEIHDRNRCIAIDLRGHGDSDWAEDGSYPIRDYVSDLDAIVKSLELKRFVLVGHSLGGMISLEYAASHPDDLAALVIVDTGPRQRLHKGSSRIRDFVAGPSVADSVDEFVERAMAFNPRRDRERLRQSLVNNLRQTPDGKWTWKYDRRRGTLGSLTPEQFASQQDALRDAARSVGCPTLLLHGAESDTYSDDDANAFAHTLRTGRLVTIAEAGHTVQGDQPYAFADALRQFLDETVISVRQTARREI